MSDPWARDRRLDSGWKLFDFTTRIGTRRRPLQPALNQPERMRRAIRYHPLFQGDGRRLLDRDRDPFPRDVRVIGSHSPSWQAPWIKNYYGLNPRAMKRAVDEPDKLHAFLHSNLADDQVTPVRRWIDRHVHTVAPGESLTQIARERDVELPALKAHNAWLANRRGNEALSGYDYLRSGERLVLPSRGEVPRGRIDPFPRQVSTMPGTARQPWLREYYEANPLAGLKARAEMRRLSDWAHRQLR